MYVIKLLLDDNDVSEPLRDPHRQPFMESGVSIRAFQAFQAFL
jgi:hypothetical protein